VLGRVERHALGVAAHRQALLAVGQHLKRGLLLYGPPVIRGFSSREPSLRRSFRCCD
jgi:hypothetical protein